MWSSAVSNPQYSLQLHRRVSAALAVQWGDTDTESPVYRTQRHVRDSQCGKIKDGEVLQHYVWSIANGRCQTLARLLSGLLSGKHHHLVKLWHYYSRLCGSKRTIYRDLWLDWFKRCITDADTKQTALKYFRIKTVLNSSALFWCFFFI